MKISVGDKELTIRKWKVKDKKAFVSAMKKENVDQKEVMDALVYSCIDEDVVLGADEFKYVFSRIRAYSLGEEFEIEFKCSNCGKLFTKQFQLKDTVRALYTKLDKIEIDDVALKLGDITNKNIYVEKIKEDELYDFLLRIKEINGNDSFTLEELESIIDDIEIDTLAKILKVYNEHKFRIDNSNIVTCDCGFSEKYIFDEIPGFLPDDWFK